MQVRHSRVTNKKKFVASRQESSPGKRGIGASVQQSLAAVTRVGLSGADSAIPPRQRKRSDFKTETKILQEYVARVIENESLRIAKQHRFLCSVANHKEQESRGLQVITVAFSSPQLTLEYLQRYGQVNQVERQLLTYTIQAVSYVLGTDPVISNSLLCVRRRAKEVAAILANAIGQSCPPPESAQLFLGSFLTV